MSKRKVMAVAAMMLSAGCSAAGEAEQAVEVRALSIWAHDVELEAAAHASADRIFAASGVEVSVNGTLNDAVQMFRSGNVAGGKAVNHGAEGWISIQEGLDGTTLETLVLHELLHHLGAGHGDEGNVMSQPPTIGAKLTAADLGSLCSVSICDRFIPE